MSTFDAIFTSLQQFPDLFSSLSFNHAVKFVHHASILKPDIIKLTQRSDSVPESASDVSASSIPDQLPSNIRTLLSESVNICEEHVDGCWVAFKQAAWEFDSKEFEQDFKAFHIPPRPLPSPFIPKQEHNREIVDLTPAMTEHGKRKLVGEMPRLSAALCPKTDRAQKLHFDPNIPNGQIAHLLPEEQEEAMKAKQWRHAIQKVFLNKEPKIAPEKLIEMDKVFTLVESFEPEHELMTCYLQYSKIGKVMRHVHILPSSKIPDDDVEFKFRDRAKVLFDKWTEILSDHSDKRMKLSPAEVVPVVSMAQGEAAVHVAPLDHLVQAGQEPDRKPEGESEGPSRPSHTSKSSAEEALVVEESSAEDKTQTGVPTPESHPVLPTTDEKASQTLVALKVEVAVSTADAVVVDQPGGGPSGRDLEGEDSEWIEVPSLDG